jgi:hypothetical protein
MYGTLASEQVSIKNGTTVVTPTPHKATQAESDFDKEYEAFMAEQRKLKAERLAAEEAAKEAAAVEAIKEETAPAEEPVAEVTEAPEAPVEEAPVVETKKTKKKKAVQVEETATDAE